MAVHAIAIPDIVCPITCMNVCILARYIHGMKTWKAKIAFLRQHAYLEQAGIQRSIELDAAQMKERLGTTAYPFGVLFEDGGRGNPYLVGREERDLGYGLG